jgi:cysteine desulfurase
MKLPIYMDHNATTPVDPRVLEAMIPFFSDIFGNAASIDHEYGNQALQAVENARERIASFINGSSEEIIFTSGATEADNLAILGVAQQYESKGKHIITCVTEHNAVLDTCNYLEKQGWSITYLPVDREGLVNPDDVRNAITSKTVLISIMTANNEIGVIAPIKDIGEIAHEANVFFHTDATQAVGYLPMDVQDMNIDLLSLSGHKIYGPKGIGALYVRSRHPRVKLTEQMHGGGHERRMRSGTLNVTGIVGLAKALEISQAERKKDSQYVSKLRDRLWEILITNISGIKMNGSRFTRLPNNLNFYVPGIQSRSLLVQLKAFASISTGSACTTTSVEPSHVIMALGNSEERAHSSVRIGLGRNNTLEEIEFVGDKLRESITKLTTIIR